MGIEEPLIAFVPSAATASPIGQLPAGILAVTKFVAVSMTDTASQHAFVTEELWARADAVMAGPATASVLIAATDRRAKSSGRGRRRLRKEDNMIVNISIKAAGKSFGISGRRVVFRSLLAVQIRLIWALEFVDPEGPIFTSNQLT
jgi:hypothetical protein